MRKKTKSTISQKWLNKARKKILLTYALLSVIIVPICSFFLYVIWIIIDTKLNLKILKTIFPNEIFSYSIKTFILITLLVTVGYGLFSLGSAHFSKNKEKKLVKEASEKAFGRARWSINEFDNPLPNKQKVKNNQLKVFEEMYDRNLDKPFYLTRSEIDSSGKKLNYWGIHVRKAVHSITIGSTGSGKGQRIIFPSAVLNSRLSFENKPCMVFSDPKGELYENLQYEFESQGYEVMVLNLRDPMYSSSWNPLANCFKFFIKALKYEQTEVKRQKFYTDELLENYIKKTKCYFHKKLNCDEGCKQSLSTNILEENQEANENDTNYEYRPKYLPDNENGLVNNNHDEIITIGNYWLCDEEKAQLIIDAEIEKNKNLAYEEVSDLATTLFNPGADDKNAQWYQGAQGLFKGLAFVMLEMLEEDIDAVTESEFNVITLATLMSDSKKIDQFFKKWKVGRETSQSVIAAAKVLNASDQAKNTYFSIASNALALFEGNELKTLLCKNTINLFEFVKEDKPKAIFMIVPDDRTDRHPLATLFVSQLYKANVYVAGQNLLNKGAEELDRDVIFFLDEFGNFPKINNFSTILTVSRGRRMFFNLVLQNLEQLETVYGRDDAKTIQANCLLTTYLKSPSAETHKTISEMCGKTTIEVYNSEAITNPKTGKKTTGYHLQEIELIKPSDVKQLFPADKKDFNKYSIVLYQDAEPALITFEYFFKMKEVLNFKKKIKVLDVSRTVNFERDYYLNLFELNIKPKEIKVPKEGNTDNSEDDMVSFLDKSRKELNSSNNRHYGMNESEILDLKIELANKERTLRHKLLVLQSIPQDQLSTQEREQMDEIWREIKMVSTKFNKLSK